MHMLTLGKTGMIVCKNGFGALPIQRVRTDDAVGILNKALAGGINFFDTARFYTDSEAKLAAAFKGRRNLIYLASKTMAQTPKDFWQDLETTLKELSTDYVDLYQFHNPGFCPKPGDESGLYDAMLKARDEGKIRFIGMTNHRFSVAKEAVLSGLYATLQYPFSYLADDRDISLVHLAKKHKIGFLAMKALAGGLINNSAAAYAYLNQFEHVLPLWGIKTEQELDEFISYQTHPPVLNDALNRLIAADTKRLKSNFCRGCAYCMPCPAGIEIFNCARMSLLVRRAPVALYTTEEFISKMAQINKCTNCQKCAERCPYKLNTPDLLKANYQDYQKVLAGIIDDEFGL